MDFPALPIKPPPHSAEAPGGFVKAQAAGPHPLDSDLVALGGPETLPFPGNAQGAGPGTTLS